MPNLVIQYVSPDRLRPYPGNARSHSRKQIKLIADSIKRFGFTNPILVTDDFEVWRAMADCRPRSHWT